MNPSITNRRGAKIRFFAIYGLSVLLVVILLSSFLLPSDAQKNTAGSETQQTSRAAVIELLQQRLAPLQNAAVVYMQKGATAEDLKKAENEKRVFLGMVDSLRKLARDNADENENTAIEQVLKSFEQSAEREYNLLQLYASATAGKNGGTTASVSSTELEELKDILIKKEEQIADLQQQKGSGQSSSNAGDSEWKERYNKLKAANEKTADQLDAIKVSYKEAVEDNRRLITQLQAVRAGKN